MALSMPVRRATTYASTLLSNLLFNGGHRFTATASFATFRLDPPDPDPYAVNNRPGGEMKEDSYSESEPTDGKGGRDLLPGEGYCGSHGIYSGMRRVGEVTFERRGRVTKMRRHRFKDESWEICSTSSSEPKLDTFDKFVRQFREEHPEIVVSRFGF